MGSGGKAAERNCCVGISRRVLVTWISCAGGFVNLHTSWGCWHCRLTGHSYETQKHSGRPEEDCKLQRSTATCRAGIVRPCKDAQQGRTATRRKEMNERYPSS